MSVSYKELVESWISSFQWLADNPPSDQMVRDALKATIVNYAPKWRDIGKDMDKLVAENERLQAIVNLIDLKQERDGLAKRVIELEQVFIDEGYCSVAGKPIPHVCEPHSGGGSGIPHCRHCGKQMGGGQG